MTFSARSFSLSRSSEAIRASSSGVVPAGRVPLMGLVLTWPHSRRRNSSGDALSTVASGKPRYAPKGAGLAWRSR